MKEEFLFAATTCVTRAQKRKLLEVYHDVGAFLSAGDAEILSLSIITKAQFEDFYKELTGLVSEEKYAAFKGKGLRYTMSYHEDFPWRLKHIHNPPVVLFYRGTLPEKEERIYAMVGARRCTAYGRAMAIKLAECLVRQDFSIASGMAYGIDGHSHRGALDAGGKTYAFVANGVDVCYPRANQDIYDRIPEHGAILSEFAPGTQPLPEFFPDRNRLISGVSEGIIVVEARERSGSLITADFALDQGRDVYALPGKVTDPLSAGCNRLIWQGAGIIRSAESFMADLLMEEPYDVHREEEEALKKLNLSDEELLVYRCFDYSAKSIDEVQKESAKTLLELLGIISTLCEKGCLREVFMNHYVRNV